ncbi:aminotransferase family protein [Chitinophaga oryzae]|nr:aminotransferase class III-fold pyridoxal phosphate-dependent enzyme [Chitinophaga oryzae]
MIVCPDLDKQYARLTHGKGVYVFDETGKRYLDGASGSAAVSNIGYGIPEIGEIFREQSAKIVVTPAHGFSSPVVEAYLDKLVQFAPEGFKRAWTVMSGTDAVENAIKLAYQYHQIKGNVERYKVIGRWSSYHGNSIFTLDVGGMKLRRATYERWMNNFPHIPPAYAYRKPAEQSLEEYSKSCSDALEKCILEEGPETVAAFVFEPVVAAALGAVPPPDEKYLREIRRICTKYDVVMIADEILTGFGRLGENFGLDRWNVKPDIIAAGKGISGGYYPLSAVIANSNICKVFEDSKTPFLGGHTFACSPLGAAIGSFVIDYMQDMKINSHAARMGELFLGQLERLYKYDIVGDVRGAGLLAGVELVRDKSTRSPFPPALTLSKRIGERSIDKGVILYPGKGSVNGYEGDHIMITPPLILDEDHIETIVSTMEICIEEVQEEIKELVA